MNQLIREVSKRTAEYRSDTYETLIEKSRRYSKEEQVRIYNALVLTGEAETLHYWYKLLSK